jgi:hypothetical protein
MKQLPVSGRYFQAYDLENRVNNKLLTLVEISGETADIIFMQVMKSMANYDLEAKKVGYQPIIRIQTSEAC